MDFLVVGAGLFGCVISERLANDLNASVLLIDKRSHIGGNCYSEFDKETGIEVHKYGTHIFHTSSRVAFDYISRFTELNGYHHQVFSHFNGKLYRLPINLETINSFYGTTLSVEQAKRFIENEAKREKISNPSNLEEKALSLIGKPLYEAFIKEYTTKQWMTDPINLPIELISRLPIRYNYDSTYFNNAMWQGLPVCGYKILFNRIISSKNITVKLNIDFNKKQGYGFKKIIYTGPIDRLFDYQFGRLSWLSCEFKQYVFGVDDFQGTSVVNYPKIEVPFTRIHEPKHLHKERQHAKDKTVIVKEYPIVNPDNPFYPVRTVSNLKTFEKYLQLVDNCRYIIGGRLGSYKYLDMDETILEALDCYEKIKQGVSL
jgi:UDP-galactopyranose mutase